MKIGIDASRAFSRERTGIEEYSYQVIKHLVKKLSNYQVVLYLNKNSKIKIQNDKSKFKIDGIELPNNWSIKIISIPILWTQLRLSFELLIHPVDVLFVPAHVVPIVHPKNTIVTVHGLEYEFCPKAYSFWAKLYMRWSIKNSCQWVKNVIAVSENTKKDLINLYNISPEKIRVIHNGYDSNFQFPISNFQSNPNDKISPPKADQPGAEKFTVKIQNLKPYLLFVGRIEERKNINGIIKAFEILKEKYKIPHSLVLAGSPGYGYKSIKFEIRNSKFEILELGYVSDAEKWDLLKSASVFLFPTFYEGFGLPILEAQSAGIPVVASNTSSLPEIVCMGTKSLQQGLSPYSSYSALLVDPKNPEDIAEATFKLISDEELRNEIIQKGYENIKKFSWDKCAGEVARLIINL